MLAATAYARRRSTPTGHRQSIPRASIYLEAVGFGLPPRISRAQWPREPDLRSASTVSNVLSVPIAALDGRPIGLLQLVDKRSSDFTDADEAVAIHLSDMTAAALERAELYRPNHARI